MNDREDFIKENPTISQFSILISLEYPDKVKSRKNATGDYPAKLLKDAIVKEVSDRLEIE